MVPEHHEEISPICAANLKAIQATVETAVEKVWGNVKERDEILRADIRSLETLVKGGFQDGRARMDRVEDWLKGQSAERKLLENRVRILERGYWKGVGIAAGAGATAGLLFSGIQILLSYLRMSYGH